MRHRNDRAVVLPVVLGTVLVLAVMALGIHSLSRHSYRSLGFIDAFLQAVAAGEACHTRLVTRLESAPWDDRWFAPAPDLGSGTFEDERYTYLIADARRPAHAHLLVRAHAEHLDVVMYWLLRADPSTLSPYRRIRTVYFNYGDRDVPMGPAGVDLLEREVGDALTAREANAAWEDETEDRIHASPLPSDIARTLGVGDLAAPLDLLPPTQDGGPPEPIGPRRAGGLEPSPVAVPSPLARVTPRGRTIDRMGREAKRLRERRRELAEQREYVEGKIRKGCGAIKGALDAATSQLQAAQAACAAGGSSAAAACARIEGLQARADKLRALYEKCMGMQKKLEKARADLKAKEGEVRQVQENISAMARPPGPASETEAQAAVDLEAQLEGEAGQLGEQVSTIEKEWDDLMAGFERSK